jgi:hypothetical protein
MVTEDPGAAWSRGPGPADRVIEICKREKAVLSSCPAPVYPHPRPTPGLHALVHLAGPSAGWATLPWRVRLHAAGAAGRAVQAR